MYRQRFFLHHDPLHLHDHHGRRHDHHHDRRRGHHRGRRHDHDEGHEEEIESFEKDINSTSFALSLSTDISDQLKINVGLSSVERAPTAVELLMDGPHLSTARYEEGNINLQSETSNNIDLSFNYENEGFYAALTFFQNDVDNYIYLLDEEDHDEGHPEDDDDHPNADPNAADPHNHGDLIHAEYVQQDAELDGYELEIGKTFELARGELTLSFAKDSVSGTFADGSNILRMVPDRNLYKVSYVEDGLRASLSLNDVQDQNDTAEHETATDGYKMLNLNLSKTVELSPGQNLTLSLFGKNLLDEVARNHSSFVKDEVPLPGRNLGIKASYSF